MCSVSARCLRKTNSSLDVTVQLIALYLPLRLSYSVMNDTVSSCFSTLVPTSCFQWMYTSSPSSSSVMKPNFLSLNHLFTRPASDLAAPMKGISGICSIVKNVHCEGHGHAFLVLVVAIIMFFTIFATIRRRGQR